ncbi:methyltransferase domain-containing protein [Microcoleus sp. D2_18a_B4]|uniref:methyltransferase domain-containing protein n=1 Tax=Microcoleus sp. D2_18a_B4 TaxID=3055329 RepID=UPI002FD0E623
MAILEQDENLILAIDHSWSDDCGLGIQGWIVGKKEGVLDEVVVGVGDTFVPISAWYPRADVAAAYPQYNSNPNCGFIVYLPRTAKHQLTFHAKAQGVSYSKNVTFAGSKPSVYDFATFTNDGNGIFLDFMNRVNNNNLRILEIGSRIVSPGSSSKRALFPGAASYTGFDYYPDGNTDVVGDAHKLSQYFSNQKFDAIFSASVFEHLAMPWVVAMEINKLLAVGGITFHSTHFAWPLHERPWDFWRFSDEGLKVLFSQAIGFEVIRSELYAPLRMHLDTMIQGQETLTTQPAFGGVAILAQKVGEINSEKFRWDVSITDILTSESHYPKPAA